MHDAAYRFVADAVRAFDAQGPVYEIGSRNINGSVRPLFATDDYVGIDLRYGPDVDVIADATVYTPPFAPQTIVCCEVLEHAEAAASIVRRAIDALAPNGLLILTAAGPERAPHSSYDGGALRDGEYYQPVTAADLVAWIESSGSAIETLELVTNVDDGDIYFVGRKA